MSDPANTISFQGMPGAYSMMACRAAYPDMTPLPCRTFVDAFEAVEAGNLFSIQTRDDRNARERLGFVLQGEFVVGDVHEDFTSQFLERGSGYTVAEQNAHQGSENALRGAQKMAVD